ncbi:hypothetical protein ABG79_00514 [Caloramator mitchellensis]|uniref:Uncharacterized protein n=1 Tax=Caloramator mitchellensis TaxID=908809 RepID=A0A0R3JVV4_CALMK|nr:hypothetical protein [Caloramator mitchellensis]KRQ87712.1 hypothetical protein ABG79_00514 [Caloramator mitchellensis]
MKFTFVIIAYGLFICIMTIPNLFIGFLNKDIDIYSLLIFIFGLMTAINGVGIYKRKSRAFFSLLSMNVLVLVLLILILVLNFLAEGINVVTILRAILILLPQIIVLYYLWRNKCKLY